MESKNIFSLFKQFAQGKVGVISFFLIIMGVFIAWVVSTSLGGIVQDKAVQFFNDKVFVFLTTSEVPMWIFLLVLIMSVILSLCIGVVIGRINPLEKSALNQTKNGIIHLQSENELFQTLIDDVEENPTGRSQGKLFRTLFQYLNREISDHEYAAQIITMLNKKEIKERTARIFLARCDLALERNGQEYFYLRKA